MKSFETKLTLRLYDTKFANQLNEIYTASGERYESKNHFLTELLRKGLSEKIHEDSTLKTANIKSEDYSVFFGQIKTLLSDMHIVNKTQLEQLMTRLKVSEKLSSAVYNMLLSIITEEPISAKQIEDGYYDELPERLIKDLEYILNLAKEKKNS